MFSLILTSVLCLASALLSPVHAAAVPACKAGYVPDITVAPKTVTYFGQTRSQPTDSLAKFCADESVDIVVLAVVHIIKGKGGLPGLNLSGYCGDPISGTDLIRCPEFGTAITKCQAKGKLVFMSLQGSMGDQTLDNDTAAIEYADSLWKLFGEGTGLESMRPFGNAKVDGFDIDNENGDPRGWPKFISELRSKYASASKKYYISAAPQCPHPDASIGDAVYLVDYLFIQFYNNFCATTGLVSSFGTWSKDIAANSIIGTKIFAGFLGAPNTGSGYATHSEMIGYVSQIKNSSNFGGVSVWDATCARKNVDAGGRSFLKAMRDSLQ
ncbi:glycoside hydrolase superfamily [Tuber borchii]|uniref:chitinase n=1 Tax=Tuber borchii TaxID=42251 RepID=A0A2T7A2T2_TUBBO|nr:glycoside hydrolase superfamily [Tuber borchii]